MHQSILVASSPHPPGYYGAFAHLVSPGGEAFANFAQPAGRAFANPGAINEVLTRTQFPILKLSTMFVLLSNLSSLTLNPVYLKWTPNVVAIHVHCRKHNIK